MGVRALATQMRRKAILDAALELFLEQGFGGTTLDQILGRALCSVGSFYHQFDNKADVAAELYLSLLASAHEALLGGLRQHSEARSGIERAVRHRLKWTGEDPLAALYLTHCREPEVAQVSEARARAMNGAFLEEVGAWLGGHVAAGTVRRLQRDLYYPLWMGATEEFTRYWLGGARDATALTRAANPLAEAAWTALRA